jgi:electron transport complex protein RnfD
VSDRLLTVSSSPHWRDAETIPRIMYGVVVALLPATVWGVWLYGVNALGVIAAAVVGAVGSEGLVQALTRKRVTALDGSAVVTGLLLALTLPPGVPLWLPFVGSVFAILVVKQAFGGLGHNFINPALAGRAFLQASWPVEVNTLWLNPRVHPGTLSGISGITQATPLEAMKGAFRTLGDPGASAAASEAARAIIQEYRGLSALTSLFYGSIGGCIGEVSAVFLLVGGLYMLARRYIGWSIPFSYVGTTAVLVWVFGGEGLFGGNPLFHVFGGGLFLGAFFMATDMVTSPITTKGKLVFGAGCGLLTVAIRIVGGYPEGVCYSILLMNLTVPLIDRHMRTRPFGAKQSGKRS